MYIGPVEAFKILNSTVAPGSIKIRSGFKVWLVDDIGALKRPLVIKSKSASMAFPFFEKISYEWFTTMVSICDD
jgi:hypothetical protein